MSTSLAIYFALQSTRIYQWSRRRRLRVPRELRHPPELEVPSDVASSGPAGRHALLINPFYPKDPHASFGKHVLTPTLALTSIAGSTPEGWTVSYWDENLLNGTPPLEPVPRVVGITVHLTFAKRAYELARHYRRLGSLVVMGGLHVESCPEEVRPHADTLVFGDGTLAWTELLGDVERGELKEEYRGDFGSSYEAAPAPRRDLLDRRAYLTTTSMIATRGCHNRCSFCYLSTDGLHIPYRARDPEQVVEEIRTDGQPYTVFLDNNLGSNREYLRQLCLAMIPLEIIWSAAVSIDITDDPSLLRLMALSGCTGVFVGFESLNDDSLASTGKRTPRARDFGRRVSLFHEVGIQVNGSFVFGFDHDSPDVFRRTVDWIEEQRLECATFHILTPYPGTPLFRQIDEEQRLLHRDWSRYDTAHVVFQPKRMTADQLSAGYAWCYEQTFSCGSIWRRRPQDPRAVLPYLAMSLLYKRSNPLWHRLIRHSLTAKVWRPLVMATRRRHLRHRRRLAAGAHYAYPTASVCRAPN